MREKYPFTGFRIVARELKLSDKLRKIGLSAYEDMDLSGIKPYPDIEVLNNLEQQQKIELDMSYTNLLDGKTLIGEIQIEPNGVFILTAT